MSHLDPETLAAFAEGKLSRQEIAPVLAHLRQCPDCVADVEAARPRDVESSMPWRNLAAAAAVILFVAAGWFIAQRRTPMTRLAKLASTMPRELEPRLTGGFAWTPYAGPMRAPGAAPDSGRMKLMGEAGEILDDAQRDPSPPAQHVAGVALTLVGRPLDAVAKLRASAEASPQDAKVWSDLAAAEYAAAARLRAASYYPAALADVDAALRIDPRLPEALFNRALILERLGLAQAAAEAWRRYLEVDPSSQWAGEAREHLRRLPAMTGDAQFRAEQPRLERAAIDGDQAAVVSIVGRFRQQSRAWGEGEYLGQWGEAELRGDGARAGERLRIARALGDALARTSSEHLLQDAVAAIDAASPERRRAIAEAHVAYRRGRVAYSRQAPAVAETDLRRAAGLFGDHPMALVARYYAANTRYDRNDVAGARAELEALLRESAAHPRYVALGAHVRWELALCLMNDDDWGGALPLAREAATSFCALGETSNCGFLEVMIADALNALGRPDEAWAARIRSFEMLSASGRGDRLPVSVGGAVRMELRGGRLAVARSLARLERAGGNDVLQTTALVREAVLDAQLGDDAAAADHAREAALAAARIPDAALRERALAAVHFADAAAVLRGDARRAAASASQAIDAYRAAEAFPFLAECHLLRARARARLGDRGGAQRDLDDGIAVCERHRIRFADGVVGTGVLDAGTALYRDAIELALARGDTAAAFAYAEHSLVQIGSATAPAGLADVQQRLAGSGAALLEFAVLPEEVAVFCVTADAVEVRRQPIGERDLIALAEAAARGDAAASASLYELLVRPAAARLAGAREAIVVTGPQLARVPFATLADPATHRMLIEQLPLSFAPTASVLRPEKERRSPRSVLAVELASDEVGLPGSVEELADVRGLYPRSTEVATLSAFLDAAREADVIHLSGHGTAEPSVTEAALLIGQERMPWRRLAASPLSRSPVVVLAACDTLRAPGASSTRALSLGGAFLAAGAGDVVGTLEPIADQDARLFFRTVHRHLAAGAGAADAVRQAQLESIRDPRRTAWRAVAVLTTRIRPL